MAKSDDKLPTLEDAFSEISELINKMENSELTLEQSLTHFERGITLIKHCQKTLETAEQKVQILLQTNNQETLQPYHEEDKNEGRSSNDSTDH